MTRPIVLVNSDARKLDAYDGSVAVTVYLEAVRTGADALPLQLPALPGLDPAPYLEAADGIVLTGARSNVHPSAYGADETPAAAPFDRTRDAINLALLGRAIAAGVPLLAICRGFQELNVALGGTLHAELHRVPGRSDHRAPDEGPLDARFALRHDVAVAPRGQLAAILRAQRVRVNSVHRQGIDRLAPRLQVEATADDGTIEAVTLRDAPAFALGVQWHPEYWVASDPPSAAIFEAFGRAVRARHASRRVRAPADLTLVT